MKRWISSIPLLLLLVASLASAAEKKASGSRLQNAAPKPAGAWDWEHAQVGPLDASRGIYMQATAQVITPAGKSTVFFGRPTDLALDPAQKLVAVQHSHGLMLLDATSGAIIQSLALPPNEDHFSHSLGGNGFHGITWEPDGNKVWLTDSFNGLHGASRQPNGGFAWSDSITLPGLAGIGDPPVPGGIAIDTATQRLYVTLSSNNTLGVVNLASKKLEAQIPVGVAPYGVVLVGGRAFVSNWGGRHPATGDDFTAESSGTDTVIDPRTGVASTGTVSVVDLAKGVVIKEVEVGLHPSGMALAADGKTIYVANANSDSVSAIDVEKAQVTATISTKPMADLPAGSAPNALTVSTDGKNLYVANGGNNAIAVIDIATQKLEGLIPTGWYPSAVALSGQGLLVANLKGVGSRGTDFGFATTIRTKRPGGHNVYDYSGSISIIPPPSSEELKNYTLQVAANMRLPNLTAAGAASGEPKYVPVPMRPGERSLFKHVIYIIKENRAYDQVLGDLKGGNGDASLTMFGAEVTPNHHALAEEFVLLDNLYCNGTLSAEGHQWTDEGYATDYIEKNMGGFNRSYPSDGTDPIAYSPAGFIWDAALRHGLTLRMYGEFLKSQLGTEPHKSWQELYEAYKRNDHSTRFLQKTELLSLMPYVDWSYPTFDLGVPDVYRGQELVNEIHRFEQNGDLPNLMVVQLGDDHTSGTQEGAPTPRASVADNDLALGQIVEALSKSKFWKDTAIFVVEDDPQDGVDHVDGHRTVGFVVSAYTRRRYHDKTFYNQNSILRTIELILGIDPLTQFDLAANPMLAFFQATPDLTPYAAKQNQIRLDEFNPKRSALHGAALRDAELSARMDFSVADNADDGVLNLILWHATKGYKTPYPRSNERESLGKD